MNIELMMKLQQQKQFAVVSIQADDYALYRSLFAQDQRDASYANTFTYITQACRGFGLGMRCLTDDFFCSIGEHKGHYVIVRPIGSLDNRFLKFVDTLHLLSAKPVFIKKLFPDQSAQLKRLGGFEPTMLIIDGERHPGRYIWDRQAFADDDTYPELIYDAEVVVRMDERSDTWGDYFSERYIGNLSAADLRSYKNGFRKFRRCFHQALSQGNIPVIQRYEPQDHQDTLQFLTEYFDDRIGHLLAHMNALHVPPNAEPDDYFQLVSYLDQQRTPIAYHVGERVGADSISLCVGVSSRAYRGLSTSIYLPLFHFLKPYGIQRINVGGAEIESLHLFKRTLAPIEERQMDMFVYGVDDAISKQRRTP